MKKALKRPQKALKPKKANDKPAKKIVVAVSGGFDPIHIGHTRMFEEAKALGDELVVLLNNDNWLRKKKGYAFMPEQERKEVIEALRAVDRVVLTMHEPDTTDMSVCRDLELLKPDIFANGGDRKKTNIPEVDTCKKIGTKMIFEIGKHGKVQSSSWLIEKVREHKEIKSVTPKKSEDKR
jgi:D-beta-D-heptose 7-phosphate kinase/D-beta-D-heptose 1-phosphate adenosyltransferase